MREFGIRIALGATRNDVHRLILRQMIRRLLSRRPAVWLDPLGPAQALRSVLFGVSQGLPNAAISRIERIMYAVLKTHPLPLLKTVFGIVAALSLSGAGAQAKL
ncbi:MAG: hypothetical protein DMG13_27595 [Acidobacteria bacterium]|nr:MAG: hypothetical protein DMG13_27595 [Acidobacteriota bacterium]